MKKLKLDHYEHEVKVRVPDDPTLKYESSSAWKWIDVRSRLLSRAPFRSFSIYRGRRPDGKPPSNVHVRY